MPSGLNATLITRRRVSMILSVCDRLDQRIEQWTVIGVCASRRAAARICWKRPHVAAGPGTGQHRLGLGDQPKAGCLAETRVGLLLRAWLACTPRITATTAMMAVTASTVIEDP